MGTIINPYILYSKPHVQGDNGYFMGGTTGAKVATTDHLDFSTSVVSAQTTSNLTVLKYAISGMSDGTTYGYIAGGNTSNTGGSTTETDRMTYATSVVAANTASDLTSEVSGYVTVSDTTTYGYFVGGGAGTNPGGQTWRIVFATGVMSTNTTTDPVWQIRDGAGVSDATTYGYVCGGFDYSGAIIYGQRITFSSGAIAANSVSDLPQARGALCGISDGLTYGYFLGGRTAATSYVTTAERITFSTGATATNTVSDLSTAKDGMAPSMSDGNKYGYGYISGGYTGDYIVSTDKITFSTGATASNTSASISQARRYLAGLSEATI